MNELTTPFKIRWSHDDVVYTVVDCPFDTKMYTVRGEDVEGSDYSKIAIHDQIDKGRILVIDDDPVRTPEATLGALNKAISQAELLHKKYKSSIDFLNIVKDIQGERGAEYEQEEGERSFDKIATVFNVYRGKDLLPSDIALILEIMKNVRFYAQDRYHLDSVIDKVSYGSLWAELVTKERA